MRSAIILSLAAAIVASPCPYGQLAERGALSSEESANFFAARSEGEKAVEKQMAKAKREEHARQYEFYKRQQSSGLLTLGGGLLLGVLQPFTGVLQDLDVPVPQSTGLAEIPGGDANHAYVAPGATDVRGMCPTLNTMANHGYISRDGITTFAEAANACQITLGFGYDTCVFLSALGLLAGGDLPSGMYSIGGMDSRVPNTLGPSLGISHHGFFEVDNSISRIDTYFGNQANFNLTRWDELVSFADANNGQFSLETFSQERVYRYNQAKADNPEFDAGVRWLAVTTAERVFIPRALPNGTDESNADYANVAPFYLNETFPENWFRRATAYSLVDTGVDIVTLLAESSELTIPGQNEGLDNFVPLGVDLANLSAANATCFLATAIFDELPGFLSASLVDNVGVVQGFLNGAVLPFFDGFDCPITEFGTPGPDAEDDTPGVSTTCNILVNGVYQCSD